MRHKWKTCTELSKEQPAAYDASEYVNCKCVRFHLFAGGCFSKKYLKDGSYHNELPLCIIGFVNTNNHGNPDQPNHI